MQNKTRDIFRRFITLALVSSFIALLIMLIVWSKMKFNIGVICPFKAMLDFDCPGCGGTRMAVSLLNLDFYQAFRYNIYLFITSPILAIVYIWQAIEYIKNNRLLRYIDIFLITYAIGLILFGIIRNIEYFSFLAPTEIL